MRWPIVRVILITAALGVSIADTAWAHHSTVMFDVKKQVTVEGTVKEWRFANPHVWLQIYAPRQSDPSFVWSFEGSATQILVRAGYRRSSMLPGDKVKVTYNPLRDGTPGGALVSVTLADGRILGGQQPGASLKAPEPATQGVQQ
jgi:Family of unknown function (DUF6152)